jgi:ribonucleoside-diphosphate reductase alpha chain
MPDNDGYINIVAVMQKYFDQAISGNWSYNPLHYENNKVPLSAMMQDLLNTYKYGWKTSYYQNTNDMKIDDTKEEELTADTDNVIPFTPEDQNQENCEACTI